MQEFETWLKSLGKRRADMPVADRGLPVSHTITYTGDVTTATLEGSVKASPDSPSELAVFSVSAPSFDAGANLTTWAFSLTGAQTLALPVDDDGDGLVTLIYDFVFTPNGGSPRRLFGGLFPISGFVTEPS